MILPVFVRLRFILANCHLFESHSPLNPADSLHNNICNRAGSRTRRWPASWDICTCLPRCPQLFSLHSESPSFFPILPITSFITSGRLCISALTMLRKYSDSFCLFLHAISSTNARSNSDMFNRYGFTTLGKKTTSLREYYISIIILLQALFCFLR